MSFSWKQLIFWTGFFELVFFFLLFGESFINWYLAGLLAIFILIYRNFFVWERFINNRLLAGGWVLFFVTIFFSSLFTHSLPLTINALVFYITALLFFGMGLTLKSAYQQINYLVGGLLFTTLQLCLFTVWFWLQPEVAKLLPSMNLIFHTFGHNHLAAWLLVVLPVSWGLDKKWSNDSQLINWIINGLPYLLMVFLFASFGRVAVMIGFGQLLLISFWDGRFRNRKYWAAILISLFIVVVKVGLSLLPALIPNYTCPVSFMQQQLCKSISVEYRPKYWQQAVTSMQNYPWVGYGPGTFNLISKKYQQLEGENTAYAHNAFLQTAAELGFLGGAVFLILMLYLLWLATKSQQWRGKQLGFHQFLIIGLVAIYLDVLFDFDWSFVGLLGTTLFILGFLINSKKERVKLLAAHQPLFARFIFYFLISAQLLISGGYLGIDTLIRFGRVSTAVNIFPYFLSHFYLFADSDQLNVEQQNRIYQIYANDPNILATKIFSSWPDSRKSKYYYQFFAINPWQAVRADHISSPAKFPPLGWENRLEKQVNFIIKQSSGNTYQVNDDLLANLVEKSFYLAETKASRGNLVQAGEFYYQAYLLDPWSLSNHRPFFQQISIDDNSISPFLSKFNQVGADKFGIYSDDYVQLYQRLLLIKLESQEYQSAVVLIDRILSITESQSRGVWEILSQQLNKNIIKELAEDNLGGAQEAVQLWYQAWEKMSSAAESDYNSRFLLAKSLQKVADESRERRQTEKASYFEEASKNILGE